MNNEPTRADLDRMRALVARELGLHFDESRLEFVSSVLLQRMAALGDAEPGRYLARLETCAADSELCGLAEHLTVGETYFFRNPGDLEAFTRSVLPDRMRQRGTTRRLRILSAGCSSGEEPYTLAMLVRMEPQLASWDVGIHAVDVNPAAIRKAKSGRYTEWALRQTPPALQARFFRAAGREFLLDESIRRMVTFEQRNLVGAGDELWRPQAYDVVFCRNVTMYFVPDVARRVIARIAHALAPGGYLFLGHAETLRGLSNAFHLQHAHGTFYYTVRTADEIQPPAEPPPANGAERAARLLDHGSSWVEAIGRASERIAELTLAPSPAARRDEGVRAGAAPAPAPTGRTLELMRDERYAEALRSLPVSRGDETSDPDVLLLRAVLLAISGASEAAEQVCRDILDRDELHAEAHYVMALCREHDGDREGAANHDEYASYLDRTFAMPHLHLGLMARRSGDGEAARRELGRALVLLAYEDPSRILLLGGGFSRDSLVELCNRELRACGGTT